MKKNVIIKILWLIFLLISISVLSLRNTFASETELPNVNVKLTYNEGAYDHYTDDDYFLNTSSQSIFTYKSNSWKSNIEINQNEMIVYGDDPIIQLIPREFFIHRGIYLYIGKEYSFFVENSAMDSYNNEVTVFIVDINRTYDLNNAQTPSQVVHELKPTFQATYLYLTNQNNFNVNENYLIDNMSGKSSVIVPKPNVSVHNGYYLFDFYETTKYFIKDVSFAANVVNEQHYNNFDPEYDPINDKGSFFIRSDLYYNGVGKQDLSSAVSLVRFGLGSIPIFSPFFDILDAIESGVNFVKDASQDFRHENIYGEFYKNATYASAVEQINHNNFLNKAIYSQLSSSNNNPLLFGRTSGNNSITCKFTLGQTEEWYTRFYSSISFNIVTNTLISGTTEIIHGKGYYVENLRNIQYKNFVFEDDIHGYSLDNGKDYFTYKIDHQGEYTFSVTDNNLIINIYNSNKELIGSRKQTLTVDLSSGYTYKVEVINTTNTVKSFILNSKLSTHNLGGSTIFSLKPYSYYLYKMKANTSCVYMIKSNNTNVTVTLFDKNLNIIKTNNSNEFYFRFIEGQVYYVMLTNLQSKLASGTLTSSEPQQANINNEIVYNIAHGDMYYSYTAAKNGMYRFNLFDNIGTVNFYKKGSTSIPSITTMFIGSDYTSYKIYLNAGDTIQFGFEYIDNKSFKFLITQTDDIFKWYINGVLIEGDTIYLKQGESKRVSVKIGNFDVNVNNVYTPYSTSLSLENGYIVVKNNAFPTSSSDQNHKLLLIDKNEICFLNIYIMANIEVDIFPNQTINETGYQVGVDWFARSLSTLDKFQVEMKFTFSDGVVYTTQSLIGKNSTVKLPKEYAQKYDRMYATVSVTSIIYKQYRSGSYVDIPVKNEAIGNYDISVDKVYIGNIIVNTMFADGTGTYNNPFQITNERHLNNIRYCSREYRELDTTSYYIQSNFIVMNDINLKNIWTPIETPMKSGGLQGYQNKYTISGITITETKGNKNIGFFRTLYGGTITNLRFNGSITVGDSGDKTQISIGMIAGVLSSGDIKNCDVEGVIKVGNLNLDDNPKMNGVKNTYTGGIAGTAMTSIYDCTNNASISSYGYIGGIVGYLYGYSINNSKNIGKIEFFHDNSTISSDSANLAAGGIVGISIGGRIDSCENVGSIYYKSNSSIKDINLAPRMGQIAGWNKNSATVLNSTTSGSTNTGNLITFKTGGFLGIGGTTHVQSRYVNTSVGKVN